MYSAIEILKKCKSEELDFFAKGKWTAVHTLMVIGLLLLVGACIACFCVLPRNIDAVWLISAFLICILIVATAIVLVFKSYLPYFMRKEEDENNKRNKIFSMLQEEYEYNNLAEKTSIGIIEKYAKAIIEEEARNAEAHRQREVKQQEYNSKVADVTCDLFKAYSSAQSPQAISDEQIVYQLIQSLTNKNK